MKRMIVVLAALFWCTAWFGGCTRTVVRRPVIDCGPAQDRYCEGALFSAPNYLGETEPEDSENRNRWLVCATDHRVVVACLKALHDSGVFLRKGEKDESPY